MKKSYNHPYSMMNLELFNSLSNDIYMNYKWKQTVFHKLSCQSMREYYGDIYILEIKTHLVDNLYEAFLYILQRMCYELENWDKTKEWALTSKQFISFIIREGYVSNKSGKKINDNIFFETYWELINGISKEDGFSHQINLETVDRFTSKTLINKAETESIYQFDNRWNNRQFLIKTHDKIYYFDWGTSV